MNIFYCICCTGIPCASGILATVAEYMQFCNFERINMENGLTPDEIRSKAA